MVENVFLRIFQAKKVIFATAADHPRFFPKKFPKLSHVIANIILFAEGLPLFQLDRCDYYVPILRSKTAPSAWILTRFLHTVFIFLLNVVEWELLRLVVLKCWGTELVCVPLRHRQKRVQIVRIYQSWKAR